MKKLTLTFALVFGLLTAGSSDAEEFSLDQLVGEWIGSGWVIFPWVGAKLNIEGDFSVAPDSTGKNYLTSLSAEKFMISYSADGLIVVDNDTDSLTWTVRDSFKKTAQYRGHVTVDGVSGSMTRGKRFYTFMLSPTAVDTMRIVIHRRQLDETETEQIGELVLTPAPATGD